MGTSNFMRYDARKLHSVLMNRTEKQTVCQNCGHVQYEYDENYNAFLCPACDSDDTMEEETTVSCESFEYDDLTDNVKDTLEEKFKKTQYDDYIGDDIQDRNYYGKG